MWRCSRHQLDVSPKIGGSPEMICKSPKKAETHSDLSEALGLCLYLAPIFGDAHLEVNTVNFHPWRPQSDMDTSATRS